MGCKNWIYFFFTTKSHSKDEIFSPVLQVVEAGGEVPGHEALADNDDGADDAGDGDGEDESRRLGRGRSSSCRLLLLLLLLFAVALRGHSSILSNNNMSCWWRRKDGRKEEKMHISW